MADLPKPKAILFDWDDTITHNWWRVFQSINKTLLYMGYEEFSEEEANERLGASGRDIFPVLFGERAEEGSDAYYKFLDQISDKSIKPLTGAVEAVRSLASETNIYLGVVSSKRGHKLREEVSELKLNNCFSSIIGSGDAVADKPARESVEMALKNSNVRPSPEVWFVGDSHTDMQCAYNNNCTAVLIETKTPPDHMLKYSLPHLRFKNCSDLTSYIFNNFFKE